MNRVLLAIISFAVLLRIIAFLVILPWDVRGKNPDEREYHQLAVELVDHHTFSSTFRMPGYPAFVSVIYDVFGKKPTAALIAQATLNVITILVLYVLASRIFNKKTGLIAAFIYAIDPLPAFYSFTLLTETVFTLVFLLSTHFFVIGVMDHKRSFQLLAGLFLGLSIFIRPITQYMPILFMIVAFISIQDRIGERIKIGILVMTVALVIITPWVARNYYHYNTIALSTQKGQNLLMCNVALMESYKTHRPYEVIRSEFAQTVNKYFSSLGRTNPFEISAFQMHYADNILKKNLGDYALIHVRGMLNMYLSPDTRSISRLTGAKPYTFPDGFVVTSSFKEKAFLFFTCKPLFEIILGLYIICLSLAMYAFAIFGFVALLKDKHWFILFLFLAIICYFTLLTGPIGDGRLKLPIIPIYTCIGAYGVLRFFEFVYPSRSELNTAGSN